jgi:hypothetical protein
MDDFKIKYFLNDPDYAGLEFPWFRKVPQEEVKKIHKILQKKIGAKTPDSSAISIKAWEIGKSIEGNAEEEDFDLRKMFESLNIRPNEKVYLDWDEKRGVDEFYFEDLSKYFDDIWYPGPDDIEIFDSTFSWVFSILHEGYLNLVLLDK